MTLPTFEMLVDAYSAELFAYLVRILREAGDAQDCLQEAYLRAYRAYPRLDARANVRAWLYRIATNLAFTQLRRRRREADWQVRADEHQAAADASTAGRAIRRLVLARLAAAVERLPAQQRAALVLRRYQGLSYGEVAAALGGTEAAARANVYQALQKLREEFGDEELDF